MRKWLAVVVCASFAFGGTVTPVVASTFNPDFVVSDAEATETASFDAPGLQVFLAAHGSGLASYRGPDIDGTDRSAAEIIYHAAQRNAVSPRFLIALLQREQSLLTDPFPSAKQLDWATGYGICDSCSMDDPALQKYRGFSTQVDDAAANFRYLFDHQPLSYLRNRDVPASIDGVTVTPRTWATAHLYTYTPHLHAQQNFWNIWQRYFTRRFPNGSIVRAEGIPGTWFIQYGQRRRIGSVGVLLSRFNPNQVVRVEANDVLAYDEGPPLQFPNYSLVRAPTGTVYLLVDDERRGIASMEVFRKLGFSRSEIDDVSWEDLAPYHDGAVITLASAYPTGALLRNPKTGGVFYVQGGEKHALVSPELLTLYFKNRRIQKSSQTELDEYTSGDPINLRDGELVRVEADPTVYVISDGARRPIADGETFEKQGWKWENVMVVSEKVLALHPLGDTFNTTSDSTKISNF